MLGPSGPAYASVYASIWRVVVPAMNHGIKRDAIRARFGLDQPPEEVGQKIVAQLRDVFCRNIEDRHVTVPDRCKSVSAVSTRDCASWPTLAWSAFLLFWRVIWPSRYARGIRNASVGDWTARRGFGRGSSRVPNRNRRTLALRACEVCGRSQPVVLLSIPRGGRNARRRALAR